VYVNVSGRETATRNKQNIKLKQAQFKYTHNMTVRRLGQTLRGKLLLLLLLLAIN